MKIIYASFFVFIFYLFNLPMASALTSTAALEKYLNGIHSMRAEFTQSILDNHGKAVQKSDGEMALARPDQFRWQVKKPIPQLIIANGERLWIYDADLEQVTIRSLKHTTGEAPALLLSHTSRSLNQDYLVSMMQKKDSNLTWFVLKPRHAENNMFVSTELGFAHGQIAEMRLQDHIGHTTLVIFHAAHFNQTLPASLFKLNVPPHVDVIDETRPTRDSHQSHRAFV